MIRLDIGCGKNKKEGFIGLDIVKLNGVDILGSLDHLPFRSDAVDEITMHHVLEHSEDVPKSMKQLYRVCKNESLINISVPYYNSPDAHRDPTHKSFFTERTMEYFTDNGVFNYYTDIRFEIKSIRYASTAIGRLFPIKLRVKLAHYIGNIITGITWNLIVKK